MPFPPLRSKIDQLKKQFLEFTAKLAPGGAYYKYSVAAVASIGAILLILVVLVALPFITAGTQNPLNLRLTGFNGPLQSTPVPAPTASPTPLTPDDGVKGTYNVSMASHSGPTITKIVFDPLDVQKGQTLTITAYLNDNLDIKSVVGILGEDHNFVAHLNFKLISGTTLKGVWQTSVNLKDSVLYNYALKIMASDVNATSTSGASPR